MGSVSPRKHMRNEASNWSAPWLLQLGRCAPGAWLSSEALALGYRGLHVEGRFLWLRRPCHLAALYSPNVVERLYEKASRAGQSPQHEANHASIYERFAARTPPLVVPKLILRLWSIQAKERSTTRRRGKT